MESRGPEGVLLTGVYGSGKSSVAAEIGYLLEQRNELYALLDLDYFGWVGDHDTGRATMLRNLAAVLPHYRDLGVTAYVLAYFVPDHGTLDGIRRAFGLPLRVVRLSAALEDIERRLAADVTSGRRDDLRDAAESIANSEGVGVEDLVIETDKPVQAIAAEIMTWLGWH
jgi:chloramphenicol 3-O-phosphotransferase